MQKLSGGAYEGVEVLMLRNTRGFKRSMTHGRLRREAAKHGSVRVECNADDASVNGRCVEHTKGTRSRVGARAGETASGRVGTGTHNQGHLLCERARTRALPTFVRDGGLPDSGSLGAQAVAAHVVAQGRLPVGVALVNCIYTVI